MAASETLYERLRRLAIVDPKSARTAFLEAFDANDAELAEVYRRVTALADQSKTVSMRNIVAIAHEVMRRGGAGPVAAEATSAA